MRGRAWVAWGALTLGILLGLLARVLPGKAAWDLLAGLLLLLAAALAVSLLPFWARFRLPPLPGLFLAPRAGERWCTSCGRPTARTGPCRSCGHTPSSSGKASALQRK